MDGTASLSFLLSSLENEGQTNNSLLNGVKDNEGSIIRMDTTKANVYLIFSAHDFNDGGEIITKTLKQHRVNASFFFTGDFYANPENKKLIVKLINDGHYLGAHSDKHLLYADWNKRDSLLVSREEFEADLKVNYQKMKTVGVDIANAGYFLPPYEWHNQSIVDWASQLGLTLINFTPRIRTNADYTTPDMASYKSSDWILNDLKEKEAKQPGNLNGGIILIHLGTSEKRTDKLYNHLGELIDFLQNKGYQLKRL